MASEFSSLRKSFRAIYPPERFSSHNPLPTPPNSPTKRRKILRTSAESEGEMTIEQYLYRIDDYRKSSFTDPVPLPWKLEEPEASLALTLPMFRPLVTDVKNILQEHGLSTSPQDCALRLNYLSRPGSPEGNLPRLTLIIQLSTNPAANLEQWGPVKDAVMILLQERQLSYEVELIDYRLAFNPSLFALHSTHSVCRAYERNRHFLISTVWRNLKDQWTAMCVFSCGRNLAKAKPSLVVMVKPGTVCNWHKLASALRGVFLDKDYVEVEFLVGGPTFSDASENPKDPKDTEDAEDAEDEDAGDAQDAQSEENVEDPTSLCSAARTEPDSPPKSGKVLQIKPYPQHPAMGASIGAPGEAGGGTLGGFALLTVGNRVHRGWITNHHLIRYYPSIGKRSIDQVQADDKICTLQAKFGYGSRDCQQLTPRTTQHPAHNDLKQTRYSQLVDSNATKTMLRKVNEEKEQCGWTGRPWPSSKVDLMDTLTEEHREQTELKALTDMLPLPLGDVLSSSGDLQTHNRMVIDWAFIELPNDISYPPLTNLLPRFDHPRLIDHQPHDYNLGRPNYIWNKDAGPIGFGALEKDEWYFKTGRTTGVTTGVCNGVLADCPYTCPPRYFPDGTISHNQKEYRTHVILGQRNDSEDEIRSAAFSQEGDSGSWVINRYGRVCGLLFGSLTNGTITKRRFKPIDKGPEDVLHMTNVGLVTCWTEILASIQSKTGGVLSLP